MPVTTNKQQFLGQIAATLKKKDKTATAVEAPTRSVLEEVIYAILREGATTPQADTAFQKIKQVFFDWNEVRVSSVQEVADALDDLPDAGVKGQRVVSFLQEVFEERYSFDLNDIAKKDGLKRATKQLARYKGGVTDFSVAWMAQRAFGGHAIPLDAPTLRVLYRLGVIDEEQPDDLEAIRGSVEHFIPKAKGIEFTETLIQHALNTCTVKNPECSLCPLKTDCPAGQEFLAKAKEKPKPKSR